MAKIKSFGAKLYLNGVSVGGLTDISASGTDVNFVDTTSHDTSGGFRTFVSGLKDGGTLDVTGKYNYADAGQDEWKAEEGIKHPFYIVLSDSSGMTFDAIVGGFQTSNPLDDAVEFSGSAKITGVVSPVFPTITVTGTLTDGTDSVTFDPLTHSAFENGRPKYTNGDGDSIAWDSANSRWVMTHDDSSAEWRSSENVKTPTLVTSWTPFSPATGTPTLTGS
jgi:predicted secreted protein